MSEANNRPTPDILDRATEALRDAPVPSGPPSDLVAATVAAVQNRLAGAVPGEPARQQRRRRIMRYVGYGTAATAAAGLLAVAGMLWFPRPSAAAEFRKALDNAERAKSVKVIATIENNGKATYVRTIYRQGDLIRMETVRDAELGEDPPVIVADLKTRKALLLHTMSKTARRTTLGEQEVRLVTGVMDGLSGIKEQVAGGDEKAVKDLGEEKLGDRKTRAYEVTGKQPPGVWKVWVDPKTELPVRVRLASENAKNTFTLDFEKWNEEFDEKLFKQDVPEGYKLVEPPEKK